MTSSPDSFPRPFLLFASAALAAAGCCNDPGSSSAKGSSPAVEAVGSNRPPIPVRDDKEDLVRSTFFVGSVPATGTLSSNDLKPVESMEGTKGEAPHAVHRVRLEGGKTYTVDVRVPGAHRGVRGGVEARATVYRIDPLGKTLEEIQSAPQVEQPGVGAGIKGVYSRARLAPKRTGIHAVVVDSGAWNEDGTKIDGDLYGTYEIRILPGELPLYVEDKPNAVPELP